MEAGLVAGRTPLLDLTIFPWLGILLVIDWFAPNTQELTEDIETAFAVEPRNAGAGRRRRNGPGLGQPVALPGPFYAWRRGPLRSDRRLSGRGHGPLRLHDLLTASALDPIAAAQGKTAGRRPGFGALADRSVLNRYPGEPAYHAHRPPNLEGMATLAAERPRNGYVRAVDNKLS